MKSLVFDAELGSIKYWSSEMINLSSGGVVLEAAGEVLVCGSFISKSFLAVCSDMEPKEPTCF